MSFVEGNLQLGIELAPGTLDKLKTSLAALEKGATLKVNIDQKPVQQAVKSTDELTRSVTNTANAVTNKLGSALRSTGAVFGSLAAVGGAGLAAITIKAISAGKEFNVLQQQVRASLTAILGTTDAAVDLLAQVNKLNDTSPFPRSAFLSATQQLVGFGVAANKVVPIIDAVQNAVAGIGGDENDIQQITRAFAQIQSQGKLTGDVLFSLGAKGIDAAAIIGKTMGKTGQQIKTAVTAGTIGAEQAIDALAEGLNDKFGGAVANVAKSFSGAFQRVQARLRDIGADLTKAFINPLGGGAAVVGLNNIATALGNIRKNVISQLLPAVQQMANLFVQATTAFLNFTNSIKTDQVQHFLQIFKELVPLVAVFGTKLVGSVIQSVPILNKLGSALGGPVTAIAIIVATVPELRQAFLGLVSALTPLVTSLLPVFESTLSAIQGLLASLAPILGVIVAAVSAFASVVTPVIDLLQNLGLLAPLLTVLIGKFLLTKVAGSEAFKGITTSVTGVAGSLKGAITGATSFGGALKNIGSSIAQSIDPIQVGLLAVTAVITSVIAKFQEAKQKAVEASKAITQGLNFNVPQDQQQGIAALTNDIERLKKAAGAGISLRTAFTGNTSITQQFANRSGANKGIEEDKKQLQAINDILEKQRDLASAVLEQFTGTPLEGKFQLADVLKKAQEAGLDLNNLRFDQIGGAADDLVKKFQEVAAEGQSATDKIITALTPVVDNLDKVRSATDALKASERALADLRQTTGVDLVNAITLAEQNLQRVRNSGVALADKVIQSQITLTQAERGVGQAQDALNIATTKYNRLLADTGASAREVADAQTTLARTQASLIDQDERQAELQKDLADLARDTPDKLAAGDRSIERAKIALNTATREQIDLQNELNGAQVANVDLTGLSVDQIKIKLAGIRAATESQRLSKGTLKTEQQIADEKETASLNVADSEANLKSSIQDRADLELSLNTQKREDEEALNALALDREETLRRQIEQNQTLDVLLSGDTQHSRDLKAAQEEVATTTDAVTTSVIDVHNAQDGLNTAVETQKNFTITIRDAEKEVETAKRNQVQHYKDIQEAQQKVREDAQKVQEATATTLGDAVKINDALIARLGLNQALLNQNPALVDSAVNAILGPLNNKLSNAEINTRVTRGDQLTDILINHPDQLLAFLRSIGLQLADGGIINKETFANIGEAGREVVLPLTRPARMADLLSDSQVLHPVLAALGRIQLPSKSGSNIITSTTNPIRQINAPSGSNVVVRRADGPATYGQMEEMIALLEKYGNASVSVEAPITINRDVNEQEMQRQLLKKVERMLNEKLGRR